MANSLDVALAPGDPTQVLDALFRLTHRLRDDLNVTLTTGPLPDDTLGHFTSADRTLTVPPDLTAEEQLHAYTQAWLRLAVGEHAAVDVTPAAPALSLVPALPPDIPAQRLPS